MLISGGHRRGSRYHDDSYRADRKSLERQYAQECSSGDRIHLGRPLLRAWHLVYDAAMTLHQQWRTIVSVCAEDHKNS